MANKSTKAKQAGPFGERLQALAKKNGTTVTALARRFEMGSNLHKWVYNERGHETLRTIERLIEMCGSLGSSIEYLVTGRGVDNWRGGAPGGGGEEETSLPGRRASRDPPARKRDMMLGPGEVVSEIARNSKTVADEAFAAARNLGVPEDVLASVWDDNHVVARVSGWTEDEWTVCIGTENRRRNSLNSRKSGGGQETHARSGGDGASAAVTVLPRPTRKKAAG